MLLKTKDRCGKRRNDAGMLMITKEILPESGNVIENKGESINLAHPSWMPLREYFPLLRGYSAWQAAKGADFRLVRVRANRLTRACSIELWRAAET
jgi:hypothetical protein